MEKVKKENGTAQAVSTSPAQEPEINEADGEPIFHAPDEEGDGNEYDQELSGCRTHWH